MLCEVHFQKRRCCPLNGVVHGAGTSNASEISQPTDDYADLVARLQGMCFGLLGDPMSAGMGMMEGTSHTEEERTASTGSVSRFESAGSAHAFDLDLGPLSSQPQGPHMVGLECLIAVVTLHVCTYDNLSIYRGPP